MFFERTLDTCVFQKTCTTPSDICNAGLHSTYKFIKSWDRYVILIINISGTHTQNIMIIPLQNTLVLVP